MVVCRAYRAILLGLSHMFQEFLFYFIKSCVTYSMFSTSLMKITSSLGIQGFIFTRI